jgi:hypothetical protein
MTGRFLSKVTGEAPGSKSRSEKGKCKFYHDGQGNESEIKILSDEVSGKNTGDSLSDTMGFNECAQLMPGRIILYAV